MTKKENAALANENGASNRADDTTFETHDFADLAEAMECLEKHVGFPVTLKALETWVVDDLLTRLESLVDDPDERLCDLRDEAVRRINGYVGIIRKAGGKKMPGGDPKLARIANLTPVNAASILLVKERVRSLYPEMDIHCKKVNGTVAVYEEDGPECGIYRDVCDADIDLWAEQLAYSPERKWMEDFAKQIKAKVMRAEYRVPINGDTDLIFFEDCIYRLSTGEHISFTPTIARRAKLAAHAPTPGVEPPEPYHVHRYTGEKMPITKILRDIAGNDDNLRSLRQVIGAAIRSGESWEKIVVFYNEHGATGKSTALELLKALVGEDSWAASDLETLAGCGPHGKYGLEACDGASLILCPDSEYTVYIGRSLQLKAIVTHDGVLIEAKFERPRRTVFHALIVCAANGLPKLRDKSDAMDSRFLVVPFEGRFERGTEREDTDIRDRFMRSQEVLDYIAWWAIVDQPHYTCLTESEAGKRAHAQWRTENDSLLDFLERYLPSVPSKAEPNRYGLYADGLVASTLYEIYKADLKVSRPGSKPPSLLDFSKQLYARVDEHPEWGWTVPRYDDEKVKMVSPIKMANTHAVTYDGCYPDVTKREGLPLGADIPGFKPIDASRQTRGRGIVRAYPNGEPPEPVVSDAVDHGTPERPRGALRIALPE